MDLDRIRLPATDAVAQELDSVERHPERPDLPGALRLTQRLEKRAVLENLRWRAVQQVDVDVIRAQARDAPVLAKRPVSLGDAPELGGDDHLVAPRGEGGTEPPLALVVAVEVG